MTEHSQNGYPVLAKEQVKQWVIPGFDQTTIPLRKGPAGFLLIHNLTWIHESVEELYIGFDDWGWSPRKISGSNVWSNHASGTATDSNSDRHPQGVRDTWSPRQVDRFHDHLPLYRGAIIWGGDFKTTVDEMHWELAKLEDVPIELIREVAAQLALTPRGLRIKEVN